MPSLSTYILPTQVVFGVGAIEQLAVWVRRLGMRRPLVVTTGHLAHHALLGNELQALPAAGAEAVVFDRVRPNPDVALVDEAAAEYRRAGCDGLIGFGGGSALDAAKAIGVVVSGVVANGGGSIRGYEWAREQPIRTAIPPTICIPTTAGSGSEVTLWAVVTDPERRLKFNVGGTALIAPAVALVDPRATLGLSPEMTAATGMDALAHAVECYTCDYAQPITDAVALQGVEIIGRWLVRAVQHGQDLDARTMMSAAATLGGMAYGVESAGAAHAMSQTAGGTREVGHGALTARLLGPVMEFSYPAKPERFAPRAGAGRGAPGNGLARGGAGGGAPRHATGR
jgi:choline dehydrogenase